jgi:hypothetical protein
MKDKKDAICPACFGLGTVTVAYDIKPGKMPKNPPGPPCPKCNGMGRVQPEKSN